MARERGWWLLGIGLIVAVVNFLEIRSLWSLFNPLDWFMIACAMIAAVLLLPRYLKIAQGPEEHVANVAVGIGLGGYVPGVAGIPAGREGGGQVTTSPIYTACEAPR